MNKFSTHILKEKAEDTRARLITRGWAVKITTKSAGLMWKVYTVWTDAHPTMIARLRGII